ncbi:HEAT repeat domain-containing protein [Tychonema sp. LEGE 07199]|uniref:HEAT repeat domain-containing protein n=1 Tax=unclassified Tychonema TaxID=2642144 RepID=UPI0018830BAA|nr:MULTISPECIES: HEAT repeat domain-containing protein [unclassified Tychonema]MBE9120576.1 HEAT repeat domain-containing protein [Tychonema sp. LEGE 07199]MBE9131596.1 HEAT repeat domain-containing protein [Tychonema sp. LEGE 07196]
MALELIRAVEQADSSEGLLNAVKALAATPSKEAIPTLITVLGYNNPGAAVAAVDGLIQLGEPAVLPLLEQLDGYNYGARAWAVRAMAGIGDPRGLEILLDAAANDFALSVRRAAARGLGTICWELMPAEQVLDAQIRAVKTLLQASRDPEWVVRYAAAGALQALAVAATVQPDWLTEVLAQLEEIAQSDETLAVRARAVLAKEKLSPG